MKNDSRGPLRIITDGDHRWPTPESPLYIPDHLKGNRPDLLLLLKVYVRTILRLEAVLDSRGELNGRRGSFTRAGGDCVCETCGLKYYDHPNDIDRDEPGDWSGGFLTILCDKSRVKL